MKTKFINYLTNGWTFCSIISLWLKNGGNTELIKPVVLKFLENYGTHKNASFVLSSWIEHGNDIDLVKDYLIPWLDKNLLEEFDASYVLQEALATEQGFTIVHDKAIEWLTRFGNTYNAKFPLSSWLKFKGNEGAKEIEHWIFYWVENFYDTTKDNWRDDLILNYVLLNKKE